MLVLLLEWLNRSSIKVPAVFSYLSTRMILSALFALLFTLLVGPKFIRKLYELKMGQPLRGDESTLLAKLHEKKRKTPTMGGLLTLTSILLSLLLFMDLRSPFTIILFIAIFWLGAIGFADDYLKLKHQTNKGLRPRYKFGLQILFAALLSLALFHLFPPPYAQQYFIPFIKKPLFFLMPLAFLMTLFVVAGTSNAVNLTDGLDGLAAGTLLFSCGILSIFAFISNNSELSRYLNLIHIEGSSEIAIFLSAMFGGTLGFLWFNGHPAEIFMGDTGSLSLGGLLAVCAILLRREFLLALVGGVFVAEALSVILQVLSFRYRGGKRIFLCAPLHHHFEYKGWPETKVVLRFWIVGLILAMLGLASLKFQ